MRLLILFSIFIIFSCKKDKPEVTCTPIDPCTDSYLNYSTEDFDAIKEDFWRPCPFGPVGTFQEEYIYSTPVFNPSNKNEISYTRLSTENLMLQKELWKFNFCTGEKLLLVDDCYGKVDWSPKGWLLYQGLGQNVYKIKDNGDSLSQLSTFQGINNPKGWNPSGSFYCVTNSEGHNIYNLKGDLIRENIGEAMGIYSWLSETKLVGFKDKFLYSVDIYTNEIKLLNSTPLPSSIQWHKVDAWNNISYIQHLRQWYKYTLDGSNVVDSLENWGYGTYVLLGLDISEDKLLSVLGRQEWKDSTGCEYWSRLNLMLMDKGGSNHRLIEIP